MTRVSMPISTTMGAAAAALVPTWAWAQASSEPDKYAYGPHMMVGTGGWYGMIFGPLIMILVLALLIVAVVLLIRWASGPWPGTTALQHVPPGRTPLDILNERYARDEIDREEYLQRRKDIGGD